MSRPPSWFTGAIANQPENRAVEVDGCGIHYLCWGSPEQPALILLHGGAAHAHWWSFIAPQFIGSSGRQQYFVIAPDLSGHGDSGRRPRYSMEQWADEVMAVARDAGVQERPIVVGHSMGGHVAIAVAARFGDDLAGAIILDAPVRRADPESEEGERGRMFRNPKTYPDLETAVEHFHLQPPQPVQNDFIVEHIARHSLKQVEAGWTWKFDAAVFNRDRYTTNDYLTRTRCRLALMHGQLSDLVTPEVQAYMEELTGRNAPMVEIPQAYHHIPLDQPLALIAAIRAILADWQHSVDKKRLRDLTT
jgi:pimeloyl-ACP methyl ester carboxylesterase